MVGSFFACLDLFKSLDGFLTLFARDDRRCSSMIHVKLKLVVALNAQARQMAQAVFCSFQVDTTYLNQQLLSWSSLLQLARVSLVSFSLSKCVASALTFVKAGFAYNLLANKCFVQWLDLRQPRWVLWTFWILRRFAASFNYYERLAIAVKVPLTAWFWFSPFVVQ